MPKSKNFIPNDSIESAKTELNNLFKIPQTVVLIKISLVLIGISWILFGIFYQFMPPLVPLLFSKPWGESQLIPKNAFIMLPVVFTVLFFINARFASIVLRQNTLMALLILSAYLVFGLIELTTIIRLMILLA